MKRITTLFSPLFLAGAVFFGFNKSATAQCQSEIKIQQSSGQAVITAQIKSSGNFKGHWVGKDDRGKEELLHFRNTEGTTHILKKDDFPRFNSYLLIIEFQDEKTFLCRKRTIEISQDGKVL